jgi:hypothetical protein
MKAESYGCVRNHVLATFTDLPLVHALNADIEALSTLTPIPNQASSKNYTHT